VSGTSDNGPAEEFAAAGFVDRLVEAGSNLGRQLSGAMRIPLRKYLRGLIPPARETPPNRNLRLLAEAMGRYPAASGEDDVSAVCDAFVRAPVIQQADHSNLLLDTETFLNNFLFHAAAREAGLKVAIHSQGSTVACLSRRMPVGGPVFLRTRGGCYQLFDCSKRLLKNSSFCALPMPATLTMRGIEGAVPEPKRDLACLFPLFLHTKDWLVRARQHLGWVGLVEEHPAGGEHISVVGSVIHQQNPFGDQNGRGPWLDDFRINSAHNRG